ncbi:MAG: hypothetical protein ABJK20_06025 [Halieaceae bacterium]
MSIRPLRFALLIFASLALQACETFPVGQQKAPAEPEPVPELTLNLPDEQSCTCVEEVAEDYTFLEKGFSALSKGDHIEAVQHFQRYQRLEKSAAAEWESGIAIAYVSMLSSSPFYDAEAARKSYRKLKYEYTEDMQVHEKTLIMAQSLESFVVMDRHIADLENNNATLKEDLEKREEAIKRLRELTLGQKGGR